MGLNEHPKLKEAFYEIRGQMDEIEAAMKPLIDEREKLRKKMHPMEVELRALNQKIKDAKPPEYNSLHEQLAAIAKAAGGYTIEG